MNLTIPSDWLEIDCDAFWKLLDQIDWKRDAYNNGEAFEAVGYESWPVNQYVVGRKFNEPRARHVAIRTRDNRYWIDPAFFKPEPAERA